MGSSGDDMVLIMNFSPLDISQTCHWQEGIEEEDLVTPGWHGYGVAEMGGQRPEEQHSARDPVGPFPLSLSHPGTHLPETTVGHKWATSAVPQSNLIITRGSALTGHGTVTTRPPCCNPTLLENSN